SRSILAGGNVALWAGPLRNQRGLFFWCVIADAGGYLPRRIEGFNPQTTKLTVSPDVEWREIQGVLMTKLFGNLRISSLEVVETAWLVQTTASRRRQLFQPALAFIQRLKTQPQVINSKLTKTNGRTVVGKQVR